MRRFKSSLFKKKKKDKTKIKTLRRRRVKKPRQSNEELEDWETNQIALARKEARHRKKHNLVFVERPIRLQHIPDRYLLPEIVTPEWILKHFDAKHLLDKDGILKFWGATEIDKPKPRLVNGHKSPIDVILNPDNFDSGKLHTKFLNSKREVAFSRKRVQLFRRLGFTESYSVTIAGFKPPDKVTVDTTNYKPPADSQAEIRKPYVLIQPGNKTIGNLSKERAIKKAEDGAWITHMIMDEKYLFIRYRVKIKHKKKILTVEKKVRR